MSLMPTSGPGSQGPEATTDWKDPFSYILENSNLVLNALGVTPPGYKLPGTVGNGYQLPGRLPNTYDQGYEVARPNPFGFLEGFIADMPQRIRGSFAPSGAIIKTPDLDSRYIDHKIRSGWAPMTPPVQRPGPQLPGFV